LDEFDPAPARRPAPTILQGRYVTLKPLNAGVHAHSLWEVTRGLANDWLWSYLSDGPFPEYSDFHASLEKKAGSDSALFFAIIDCGSNHAGGYASFMRIEPAHRCMEVGNILYSPALQRTRGGTEAMYLMARHAFEELGYRRYEWKCNALNEPSRRAAGRLGFQFEGIFRQHMIIKGRNRDTAWFSMLDREWPARKAAFESWLDPINFDANGKQIRSLSALNSLGSSTRQSG
jgi:RimJ/RimL family protein N-acetyltransferase